MKDLVEKLTRKLAKTTTVDGAAALVTDGDKDLADAFAALGWSDPRVDTPATEPVTEVAVLGEPEEVATEKRPRARGSR